MLKTDHGKFLRYVRSLPSPPFLPGVLQRLQNQHPALSPTISPHSPATSENIAPRCVLSSRCLSYPPCSLALPLHPYLCKSYSTQCSRPCASTTSGQLLHLKFSIISVSEFPLYDWCVPLLSWLAHSPLSCRFACLLFLFLKNSTLGSNSILLVAVPSTGTFHKVLERRSEWSRSPALLTYQSPVLLTYQCRLLFKWNSSAWLTLPCFLIVPSQPNFLLIYILICLMNFFLSTYCIPDTGSKPFLSFGCTS